MAPILSGQIEGRRRPKMAILGSAQLPAETSIPSVVSTAPVTNLAPRHSALVRFTHWITTICFFALLLTGIEIVISHPRFYWGETGTVLTTPLFQLPIPSSRRLVSTGSGVVPVCPRLNGLPGWILEPHRSDDYRPHPHA